jgi:hypothetical protein
LERQAKEFAEAQSNLKPLTKEQWEEIQELRPRTPFESRLARNHARIRTGEPLSLVNFLYLCPLFYPLLLHLSFLTYFLECFFSLVSEYCAGGNHVATPSADTQLLT